MKPACIHFSENVPISSFKFLSYTIAACARSFLHSSTQIRVLLGLRQSISLKFSFSWSRLMSANS